MATATMQQRESGGLASAKATLSRAVGFLGRIGKSLLFPIAALPIAAILLRVGDAIPATTEFSAGVKAFLTQSGGFVFGNLHLVFATGVAFGLTKDNRGEAAFVGLLGMLLMTALISKGGADLVNAMYKDVKLDLVPGAKEDFTGFRRIFEYVGGVEATTGMTIPNPNIPGDVARQITINVDKIASKYDDILAKNVLAGFAAGSIVAFLYNRFNGVELPSVLGFFSGRRLIPVLGILSIMVFSILWAIIFPWIGYALFLLSEAIASGRGNRYSNAAIMGVYAILNRLLIPFGLHHIPNTIFWFTLPTGILDANGNAIAGDINAFLQGVPAGNTAGTFQTGFFPIMMFGLPALVGAFWFTADSKEQKREVIALYGSAALVSFLTGITEPIEFAFLFIAPVLYGMHVLLSGVFAFITGMFGIQLGFGFSAGLLDYGLSLPKSLAIINAPGNMTDIQKVFANPGWIWPIGAVTAATYFGLGSFIIKKFNLQVPGRGKGRIEREVFVTTTGQTIQVDQQTAASGDGSSPLSPRASTYIKALGGYENITNFQNCTTRLRYDVKDADIVDDEMLKKAGAKGVIHVGKKHVQIVVGLDVEKLNNEIIAHKPQGTARKSKAS